MSRLLICCTAGGEPEGLMVKLRRAPTAGEAPVQMIAAARLAFPRS
jgi:hypothetical protein